MEPGSTPAKTWTESYVEHPVRSNAPMKHRLTVLVMERVKEPRLSE